MGDVAETCNPHPHITCPLFFKVIHELPGHRELQLQVLELLLRTRNSIGSLAAIPCVHDISDPFQNLHPQVRVNNLPDYILCPCLTYMPKAEHNL
jgi:hypothetical protein